jgi:hypothetical protein
MRTQAALLSALLLAGLTAAGCVWLELTTELDYRNPETRADDGLADDRLEDRPAPAFDPGLVDRRPLGGWRLNASAAVVRLDVPALKPGADDDLRTLRPSYAAAFAAARSSVGGRILPSVNLVDGKAKQFDDGLVAALDLAWYRGLRGRIPGQVALVRRMYDAVGKDSPAAPFLAAGLELAGVKVDVANPALKESLLRAFEKDETASRPAGFYVWDKELTSAFRFMRFFQQRVDVRPEVAAALRRVLEQDAALRADYAKAVTYLARGTNRLTCRPLLDLGGKVPVEADNPNGVGVALFPASSSREKVLFEKLFASGLPPDADLMKELVRAVRSGKVDLRPGPGSGWYEYQVHALETLLLPERGEEAGKLLLTRAYKKRMLEAFKALVAKRRETHLRQLEPAVGALSMPPGGPPAVEKVSPRLRVEPCPSYYLRTARAYAFLLNVLESCVGADGLRALHGLREGGKRGPDLYTELNWMRDLCYGLYLVSAEDIGLKPAFADGEAVDADRCYRLAADWLPTAFDDADARADARVAVPVFLDPNRGVTRVWATLGVRLARLDASYARPPHVRRADGGTWEAVEEGRLEAAHHLILVDEFAEVELRGLRSLTREEFRAACDRGKTREEIVKLLRGGG